MVLQAPKGGLINWRLSGCLAGPLRLAAYYGGGGFFEQGVLAND
jgi:hypothetical protein